MKTQAIASAINARNLSHPSTLARIHGAMTRARVASKKAGVDGLASASIANARGHDFLRVFHDRKKGGFSFHCARTGADVSAIVLQTLRADNVRAEFSAMLAASEKTATEKLWPAAARKNEKPVISQFQALPWLLQRQAGYISGQLMTLIAMLAFALFTTMQAIEIEDARQKITVLEAQNAYMRETLYSECSEYCDGIDDMLDVIADRTLNKSKKQ